MVQNTINFPEARRGPFKDDANRLNKLAWTMVDEAGPFRAQTSP